MSNQGVFPGWGHLFREKWNPNPHTLARVKNYLEGFAAHGRTIHWKLRTAAARLDMGRSTLCRYLRYLREQNWLATVKVTMRYAIRKVLGSVKLASPSGTPCGTPIEVKPEASQNQPKQNSSDAPSSGGCEISKLPVGYCEAYQRLVEIFDAAGKARNDRDLQRGHAAFIGIGVAQWEPAIACAMDLCQKTANPRFIPSLVNFLLDEPWTRVAVVRTLPVITEPTAKTKGRLALESSISWFLNGGGR
jgi:hypothetical protein